MNSNNSCVEPMQAYIQFALAPLGVGCLVWSAISYFRVTKFLRVCTETRGEVVRLERTRSSGEFASYAYAPVFQFQTGSGESVTVTSKIGSSPAGFRVGESVLVRYDPTNPRDAKIHTFLQTWGSSAIPAAIGVLFLGIVAVKLHLFSS
jgi:hypothetical protein